MSGLLFADDLLLVARSSAGLQTLLDLVKRRFDLLKLTISQEKSEIISPDNVTWELCDRHNNVEMTLKQVSQYKYLGTWTFGSLYRTIVEKQKNCVRIATKYKNCCIFVSKMGPDVVDVVLCTWCNVAIPAILSGCETIPFSETQILEVERIQSQVAKFALGVPISFPNISCQSELGMKTFRQLLYERQLKFFFRVLYQDSTRWSHQAIQDHMSGTWASPYMSYIYSLRSELGVYTASHIPSFWKLKTSQYFLDKCNAALANYCYVAKMTNFSRLKYVCENDLSSIITKFKYDNADLGNKTPRPGYSRKLFCPLCPTPHKTSCFHILFVCSSVSVPRATTGIQSFITVLTLKGVSLEDAFMIFVNGLDSDRKAVSMSSYLERARCMNDMRSEWLSRW